LISLYLHYQVVFEDTITHPNRKVTIELDSFTSDSKMQVF
jgi:hypothetical protein